jgi:phenylacetate-CoA ligase
MKKILESIYFRLPLFMQNYAITAFGYHWYDRRFGGIFTEELKKCKQREFNTFEEWNAYQETKLRELLVHSYQTVPYYKNLFENLSIIESDLRNFTLDKLSTLPMLEKDTFRKLGVTELISSKREPKGEFYSSSGSTGTPTETLFSLKMHQKYFAIYESRINNWAGINYTLPRGVIGGRRIIKKGIYKGPFYRYNAIEKQVYFSAYHISANTVENYLEGMRKHNIEYMAGYAMSNYILARFIEKMGLEAPKLKAVKTSSEKLTQEMRDTFERVYGCKTYDSYNGVEACNLISECEHGKLHIVPDVGIVEVLDKKGNPCLPGDIGEVVSTGLLNFDQPLIRYRMGDFVKLSNNQSCNCGRNMFVVDEIIGRFEDVVIGSDGREMVRFHGIFINIKPIVASQVIQHTLKNFEIKLVVSEPLTDDDFKLIKTRMESQLGEINLNINLVNSIPRGSNGKFKAVVSHL